MSENFSDAELESYLEETLDTERMAQIEQTLRARPELLERLTQLNSRRDSGMHSLGAIWRRNQIGLPTREELGSYLLGVLPPEHADYITFRIEVLKCRFTIANLADLEAQQKEGDERIAARRQKYFQSSVGHLDS